MSVKKNIVANYIGQGWAAFMGLAFVPIYIGYLGVEAYGLIGFYAMLQAWLAILDMGMTPTLNREMARYTAGVHTPQAVCNLLRSLELISFATAAIVGLMVWVAAEWLAAEWLQANKLPLETVSDAIAIMGLVVGLRFVESIYRGAILGMQKQVFFNVVNAGLATLRYAGAVGVLAWVSATIEAFFIWQGIISTISMVILAKSVRGNLPLAPEQPAFSWGALKEIRHFASGMMVATLLALLLTQVDKILLSRLLDLEEFGYYTLAGVLAGVVSLLINPIAQAVSPHMAKLATHESEEGLVGAYHNAAQLLTVMAAPMALIICNFAEGAIFAWSGNQNLAERTGPILSVLVIGNLLSALMVIPFMLQLAYGWVGFAIKFNLVAVLMLIPTIMLVVPRFGALGAAWVWVILNMSYILIGIQLMHRRFISREKWTWYIKDIAFPIIGAFVISLLAKFFSPTGYENRWSWFVFLVISTLLAFGVSLVSAELMRKRVLFILLRNKWLCNLNRLR